MSTEIRVVQKVVHRCVMYQVLVGGEMKAQFFTPEQANRRALEIHNQNNQGVQS